MICYLQHENQPPVTPIIGYPTSNQGLLQSGYDLIQAGDWEGVVAQTAEYTGLHSQRPFISDSWRLSELYSAQDQLLSTHFALRWIRLACVQSYQEEGNVRRDIVA